MTKTLSQEIIKQHIIHRHENLLLDSITIPDPKHFSGNLSLSIQKKDPLNRNIFLKEHSHESIVLQTPILMEILALASIVVSGKLKKDEMVIFAAISNFQAVSHYLANTLLSGKVNRVNAKNNFLKYKGELYQAENIIASGEMTAFFTQTSHTNMPEKTSFNVPTKEIGTIKKHNRHKVAEMIIIDTLYDTNEDIISSYTYPDHHPLIRGHFPGNPLMMGVMQWMSLEDTLCAYLEDKKLTGINTWQCDAAMFNQHGHKIADIKSVTLKSWINDPSTPNQTEIQATKRINFRTMVKPNDTLYTVISNLKKT